MQIIKETSIILEKKKRNRIIEEQTIITKEWNEGIIKE